MAWFSLDRASTVSVLLELAEARHLALVKGTERILMAWPFSAIATPFVVETHGHRYFANCSWDAIAFHAMLGEDVHVESRCHQCAAAISIELVHSRAISVAPSSTIVYLALRPSQWWEDIITTCSNTMVFFCSPEHRDVSNLCAPAEQAASITPDQAHRLGVPLYRHRLKIDYQRPGRDDLNAHFASLGLTGPYWQI